MITEKLLAKAAKVPETPVSATLFLDRLPHVLPARYASLSGSIVVRIVSLKHAVGRSTVLRFSVMLVGL